MHWGTQRPCCSKYVYVKITSHFPSSIQVFYRKTICIGLCRKTDTSCTGNICILVAGFFYGHWEVQNRSGKVDMAYIHIPTGHQDSPHSNTELPAMRQCCCLSHAALQDIQQDDFFQKEVEVLTLKFSLMVPPSLMNLSLFFSGIQSQLCFFGFFFPIWSENTQSLRTNKHLQIIDVYFQFNFFSKV